MSLRSHTLVALTGMAILWCMSGTQRQKPILSDARQERVAMLEKRVASHPADTGARTALGHAYLEAGASGLAIGVLDPSAPGSSDDPEVLHARARALIDQGQAGRALAVERQVLALCRTEEAAPACEPRLIVSATRRVEILSALRARGVEDVRAHPEESQIAYVSATRHVRLSL